MEDKNEDRKLFQNWAQVIRSARKGMRKKQLAARCGMSVRQFNAVVETRPDIELAIEQAYADYDEEQRDGLDRVLSEAIESKELSLQAKILRENQKEANEREREEREERLAKAVESLAGFELIEPEYGSMSEERKAEIAAQVEAMEAMSAEMGSAENAEDE